MQRIAQAAGRVARQGLRLGEKKGFHSSGATRDADYEHRLHMYELWNMKNRNLKMGLGVLAVVGLGTAIPLIAAEVQFWKASGGGA